MKIALVVLALLLFSRQEAAPKAEAEKPDPGDSEPPLRYPIRVPWLGSSLSTKRPPIVKIPNVELPTAGAAPTPPIVLDHVKYAQLLVANDELLNVQVQDTADMPLPNLAFVGVYAVSQLGGATSWGRNTLWDYVIRRESVNILRTTEGRVRAASVAADLAEVVLHFAADPSARVQYFIGSFTAPEALAILRQRFLDVTWPAAKYSWTVGGARQRTTAMGTTPSEIRDFQRGLPVLSRGAASEAFLDNLPLRFNRGYLPANSRLAVLTLDEIVFNPALPVSAVSEAARLILRG